MSQDHVTSEDKHVERKTRRLTVDLSEEGAQHLDWLQDVTAAASTAEVIRNALKLYYGVMKELEQGNQFHLTNSAGESSKIKNVI